MYNLFKHCVEVGIVCFVSDGLAKKCKERLRFPASSATPTVSKVTRNFYLSLCLNTITYTLLYMYVCKKYSLDCI